MYVNECTRVLMCPDATRVRGLGLELQDIVSHLT